MALLVAGAPWRPILSELRQRLRGLKPRRSGCVCVTYTYIYIYMILIYYMYICIDCLIVLMIVRLGPQTHNQNGVWGHSSLISIGVSSFQIPGCFEV